MIALGRRKTCPYQALVSGEAEVTDPLLAGTGKKVLAGTRREEARRNLAQKAPEALSAIHELLTAIKPQIARKPTSKELKQAAAYIHLKDAPVVAAAIKAKVDCLVTW